MFSAVSLGRFIDRGNDSRAAWIGAALVLLAAVALWSSAYFDWIALRAHPAIRVGALLLVLSVCGIVYFGALAAMGFRFRHFRRISN